MCKALALTVLVAGVVGAACAAKGPPARPAVKKLLGLYMDDRPRFVRHLQALEQGGDCDHVEDLKDEAAKMDFEGAVPRDQQRGLVVVKLELAEAEKICRK